MVFKIFLKKEEGTPLLFYFILFFILFFLELHLGHMEVPRLGAESELQLLACATATATWGPSHICDLCCRLWQCWIFNHWARPDIKPAASWTLVGFLTHWTTMGTPSFFFFWVVPAAYGSSQASGRIGAVATGLRHSHSHSKSEPRLWTAPQLMATPDPGRVCDLHNSSWQTLGP